MVRFGFTICLMASLFAGAVSCGSDKAEGTKGDVVEDYWGGDISSASIEVDTLLAVATVKAGKAVDIGCKVLKNGSPMVVPAEVVIIHDSTDQVVEPGETVFEQAGLYSVACRTKDGKFKDETPAEFEVVMGEVATIETTVKPPEVVAGGTGDVFCLAIDAYGNSAQVTPGFSSTPSEGVAVDGHVAIGEKVGTYQLNCLADAGVDVVAASFTVSVGPPGRFIASVDPGTVGAGDFATVGCTVEDKFGNPQQADWVVMAPEGVEVEGVSIYSVSAGTHKIKCAPKNPTGDEELVPADFTVTPGTPVGMNVYAKPDKDHYCIGDLITIKHELVDQYDNFVGDAEIDPIEVVPADAVELQPNKVDKFIFIKDGTVSFSVTATEHPYSGQVESLVDCTGPKITITYPPRAHTFTGPNTIAVTGFVEEQVSGIASLTINEQEVNVDADGGFNFPLDLQHGMTLIAAEATDGLGNVGKGFRSSFYSTKYIVADNDNPDAAMVPSAIWAFLAQDFIDDCDHSSPPDDIATVVETVMEGFDISGLLPEEGLELTAQCSATVDSIEFGKPTVNLQTVDGGIHLTKCVNGQFLQDHGMEIPDLVMNMTLECCYEVPFIGEYCDQQYLFIYADAIVIGAYLFIGIDGDGNVSAELGPLNVDFLNLDVDIQGVIGGLFDPLVDLVITIFKDMLIDQFQTEFGDQLPEMVEDALGQLSEGQVIELPPLIGEGDPTELLLSLDFALLEFSFDGLELILDAAITAPKGVTHEPLGVLARDGCMGAEPDPFVLIKDAELAGAGAVDLINEALYSVWNSGSLTLDLTAEDLGDLDVSEFGIENLAVAVDMYYPPIMQSCGTGEKLELQLGDAFVHAKFFMMNMNWDIQIFMFMVMEATPILVESEEGETQLSIEMGEMKVAEVDVVAVGEDLLGKEQMVEDLFKGVLLPTLTDQLLGELGGFAIPEFDLSSLDDTIPEGTTISMDLETLAHEKGYLVVGGKLK